MASKSVVMASSFTGEAFESVDVEFSGSDSDSDSWQVIDPSDSDDGNFSYDDVTTDDDDDGNAVPDVDDLLQHPYGSPSSDISMQSLVDEITHHSLEIDHIRQLTDGDNAVVNDGGNQSLVDEITHHSLEIDHIHPLTDDGGLIDGEDDSDLDDELVPKWLNNKFGRQRMRKLGKRVYPKMKKSKRLAYMYNKPGCVHGKHGLGMKHNLMIW